MGVAKHWWKKSLSVSNTLNIQSPYYNINGYISYLCAFAPALQWADRLFHIIVKQLDPAACIVPQYDCRPTPANSD